MPAAALQRPDSRPYLALAHSRLIHGPLLESFLRRQRIARLGRGLVQELARNIFADCRPMLESVPRPAADEPHIFHLRMPVDQKIAVRCIFVLADARLDHWRIPHGRKTAGHIFLNYFRFCRCRQARLRVGIDALAVMIERNFQPAAFNVRHPVILILLKKPRRQSRRSKSLISWGHAEEENFLPARKNSVPKNFGENFAEPRSTSEDKLPRRNRFAVAAFDVVQWTRSARRLD